MSKKLLFKGRLAAGMRPYEIEDFSSLYIRDARVDEKTKAYIDSVIGNSVLNLCPYRNVLVTHKYDTVEGNVITLDDCQDDEVIQLSEVQGNTMVNCCKDGSKELTLNGNIDTSGYNNVTLTEGVDGGKVDIALEGNTMVNVCDQEDPIAITKNYEVTTGNHVALQGEYDGKCRPNIYGNTLWIDNDTEEILMAFDGTKNLRLQSSFEDKLITDEKDAHNGKYKVDYKVTGKNKFDKSKTLDGYEITDAGNGTIGANAKWFITDFISVIPNTSYSISGKANGYAVLGYDKNKQLIANFPNEGTSQITIPNNVRYIKLNGLLTQKDTFQLEEGDTATTYESYKEFTKTLYLNTPLLEGDTIEQSGNDIVHMHRYNTVTFDGSDDEKWVYWGNNTDNGKLDSSLISFYLSFTNYKDVTTSTIFNNKFLMGNTVWGAKTEMMALNADNTISFQVALLRSKLVTQDVAGFKTWLQANPITVAYELATPTREVISTNDNLLLDSYVNGHLDVDSIVPIDKVVFQSYGTSLKYLSPSTEYIIQFESDNNGKLDALALNSSDVIGNLNIVKGINKFNITTSDKITINYLWTTGIGFNMSKVVVTPKVDGEFGYFKGMKSVGQNDVDGHEIEILSSNKNLFNIDETDVYTGGTRCEKNGNSLKIIPTSTTVWASYNIKIRGFEHGEIYTLSCVSDNYHLPKSRIAIYEKSTNQCIASWNDKFFTIPNDIDVDDIYLRIHCCDGNIANISEVEISDILIEKGQIRTQFVPHKQNKKEILMNEPLRGLPNGVRDKYVIIDGKWYIKRNCMAVQFKDLKYDRTDNYQKAEYPDVIGFRLKNTGINTSIMCDRFAYTNDRIINFGELLTNKENINIASNGKEDEFFITIQKAKLKTLDFNGLKNYFTENPMEIIAKATTPTYEPIEYNPFEVYSATTHISNNSIIPCNMVIKNTGYNCILKPSTLYTVALDTNKSGTIGINLGGAKVTTSNNVATITTPATLTDNTLRLYGKGIKASGVRLLEGDKTNWTPSHFEGMKSCFEDKLQEDGKYKMEILMNNENLLDIKNISYKNTTDYKLENNKIIINTSKKYQGLYYYIPVKRGSRYTICCKNITGGGILLYNGKITGHMAGKFLGDINNNNPKKISVVAGEDYITIRVSSEVSVDMDCIFEDTLFYKGTGKVDYVPHKQNKIQFLLNEPLRRLPNGIKDKVYVKEDKIVVQRNCGHKVLDGTETSWQAPSNDNYKYGVFTLYIPHLNHKEVKMGDKNEQGALCNTLRPYWWWTNKDSFETVPDNSIHYLAWDNYDAFYIIKKNLRTVDEFKQWLKANKTEYIYPLAEPVYEEVECDLSKLALEGYDHGTLFYDTNIPVTTQFYEFNVNVKDMLIPNETYYVTFNADRVKDITINLSGVQVNYKTSMGYNKVPIQLGDVVNINFSMDSRGVELSDLMVSTSTSLIYVKDMNDVCVYDEASNKYSITITSTNGKESDKRVILLDYPLLRLNKDIYDRLYYSNKDSRYRIDKKVFKHKFTNDHEYNKYAAETNDTYYSSFISLNEAIKDYVVITNEKVKTVKVEDDKYYFKIKWSDLGVSDKTEVNGNQGMKDFFNNNEVYLYYATDGFVEVIDGLRRQTLKVYQSETFMEFSGNTTTTVTILIPMKNI